MIDKILTEFNKLFSFKNLYFNHFRRITIYPSIILIYLMINALLILSIVYNNSLLFFFFPTPLFLVLPILKIEKIHVVTKVYKYINVNELYNELKKTFHKNLRLIKIDLSNIKQLKYLLKTIEKNINDIKPNLYLKGGLIIAILAPIWTAYCNKLFSLVIDQNKATYLLFLMLSILTILLLFIYAIKTGIYDDIKYMKLNKLKSLYSLLEDSYIEYLNTDK